MLSNRPVRGQLLREPSRQPAVPILLLLSLGVFLLLFTLSRAIPLPFSPFSAPVPRVWLSKPVLGYFALTASLSGSFQVQAGLSAHQFTTVQTIAQDENQRLSRLEDEGLALINDPSLSLEEIRSRLQTMGYNARVKAILLESDLALRQALDGKRYQQVVRWIEQRWQVERRLHGLAGWEAEQALAPLDAPRSYKIFATHYDSNGAYTVALPDKCVKFANAGRPLSECTGYSASGGYTVIMSYDGSTGAAVGEAGPWNVDDAFWATRSDPTPRRMFADLPLGMPEAQAAYFDGYNGGTDQYGRVVTAPFAIDLGEGVGADMGLKWGKNDWITVSFMWTDGWGKKDKNATPGQTAAPVIALTTATPHPDGSIIHTVQDGQVLWNIAAVYEMTLDELLALNNLTKSSFINPGDELIIKPADATPTATASPEMSPTPFATYVSQAHTPTATKTTLKSTQSPAPGPTDPAGVSLPGEPALKWILGAVVIGLGMVLVGLLAGKRKM